MTGRPAHDGRVAFRVYPDGEVLALMVDIPWDGRGSLCASYAHVGQHGGAWYAGVVASTRPATEQEYAPLLRELERIGYRFGAVIERWNGKRITTRTEG